MIQRIATVAVALLAGLVSSEALLRRQALNYEQNPQNNYACRSLVSPYPVVVVHGLLSTYYTDIDRLEAFLKQQGFCTFSATYGALPGIPYLGGVRSIADSSREVADFIMQVAARTGSPKVDLVGHSEGGFQVLYVPKFYSQIAAVTRQVISIAPPTHGTTLSGIYLLAYLGGQLSRALIGDILEAVGCGACDDLGPDGPAVKALTSGPIAVPGIFYSIFTSHQDEIVTPPKTSFVQEPGVRNFYIQDYCPNEVVGHLGEPHSPNVMALVSNTLRGSLAGPQVCSAGPNLLQLLSDSGWASLPPDQELIQTLSNVLGTLGPLKA